MFRPWIGRAGGGLFVLALCACYSPSFERCGVRCGAGGSCPSGLECSSDNFCLPHGETCAGVMPDAGTPGHFRALSAGYAHTCAIDDQGALWCWGANDQGQLGAPVGKRTGNATRVGMDSDWIAVDAGFAHTCGLREGGKLFCWGENGSGEIGDGTEGQGHPLPTEVATPASGSSWIAVAAGGIFTCGIRDDHSLWCWGANPEGQLAQPVDVLDSSVPVRVGGDSDWAAVDVAAYHACGIREDTAGDGDLYCWGSAGPETGGDGRLGLGTVSTSGVRAPTRTGESGELDWASVELGDPIGCGLDGAGALYCWGPGTPGTDTAPLVPTRYSTGTYAAVSTGGTGGGCLLESGTALCWGYNGLGQLGVPPGDGTVTPSPVPNLTGVAAISVGNAHACAQLEGGEVRCWGDDGMGQIGDGTVATKLSPTEVGSSLAPWAHVDVGQDHTCGVTAAGAGYCWGKNADGQIGNATAGPIAYTPAKVDFSGTWKRLRAGAAHSCGLDSAGAVWCWGANYNNQLGAAGAQGAMPVMTSAAPAGGGYSALELGPESSCAIDPAGVRVCWGLNEDHELGTGNADPVPLPTAITGGASVWTSLGLGRFFGCGVGDAGKLWCWGANDFGQLARAPFATSAMPLEVTSTASGFSRVAAGGAHACGLRAGQLLCWGNNTDGQTGSSTGDAVSTPFQVANSDWTDVDLGNLHTCALRGGGDLFCWGNNYAGQLGDGSTSNHTILGATLGNFHDWQEVSGGGDRTCAIRGAGQLYCWGENGYGAIGDGTGMRYQPVTVTIGP
jgi:alpha-tubulin suppressor-like RCC1 family protein